VRVLGSALTKIKNFCTIKLEEYLLNIARRHAK